MSAGSASSPERKASPAAVNVAFTEVWEGYAEAWSPLRRALEEAVAAHELAVDLLGSGGSGASDAGGAADGDGGAPVGEMVRARYRGQVAAEVLDPLWAALKGPTMAAELEAALHVAAEGVRGSLPELEAAERRDVERVVLPGQRRAFRLSQRRRARWLGRLERAWHEWGSVVLAPPPDGAEGGEGPAPDAAAEPHLTAARALQTALVGLTEQIGPLRRGAPEGKDASNGTLRAAFDGAGRLAGRVLGRFAGKAADGRDVELARQWDAWAAEAATRLALYREFLGLRSAVEATGDRVVRRWRARAAAVEAVLEAVAAELVAGRERVLELGSRAGGGNGFSALQDALRAEKERTGMLLQRTADALPLPADFVAGLTDDSEEAIRSLSELADGIPEAITVHDVPEPGDRHRRPGGDSRTIRLRGTALQAFDTLRVERIRSAPGVTEQAMDGIRAGVAQLCEVSAYGYEAAIAELAEREESSPAEPVGPVTTALSRALERAGDERLALRDAIDRAEARLDQEVSAGFRQLVQRVLADRLTAGYLDARSYLAAEVADDLDRWRGRAADVGRRATGGLQAVRRRFQPLAWILGIGRETPADTAGRTLARADEMVRSLPVVYRRLFAFEPLADPRLLAGRDDAMAELSGIFERRSVGDCRSVLVVAAPGSGITSFLNIAARRLFGAARAADAVSPGVRDSFRERIREEPDLVALLSGWLGVDGAGELDGLADLVMEAPPDQLPRVVVLEGLEHLHMRVQGGAELFENFLTFMSRTETRIFWVAGLPSSAWQLIEKRSRPFVGDVERVNLGALGVDALREAILARHRLSGLPLRFAEPQRRQDVLRQRARQLRGPGRQQYLVEADYFQRLHRASLGSVRMAMFHWLRSADFDTVEGSLLVKPLETLTPFMSTLDVSPSFALKALMDHGTLTVEEYCAVSRTEPRDGYHLFRSLVDLHVVEMANGASPQERGSGSPVRYRIRPLMTGAVAAHLRSLNILH